MLDFALKVALNSANTSTKTLRCCAVAASPTKIISGHRCHRGLLRAFQPMADLISMRPNDEFHLLGRLPEKPLG